MTPSTSASLSCRAGPPPRTSSVRGLAPSPLRSRKLGDVPLIELRGDRWSPNFGSRSPPPPRGVPLLSPPAPVLGTQSDLSRRLLASVPTAARCGGTTASADAAHRTLPAPVRAFAPAPRRAASSSRARPLPEPPAPQPASARLCALDLARGGAAARRASQLVAPPRRVHFGNVEVHHVECHKAAMKELMDPRTKTCIECDICGEFVPRSQRPEDKDKPVIRRMSKMDWICTTCLSDRKDAVSARLETPPLGTMRKGSLLRKVRSAAEYIMGDGGHPTASSSSEQLPSSSTPAGNTSPECPAKPLDVPEGARAPSVPARCTPPATGAPGPTRPQHKRGSHLERLLEAAGATGGAAAGAGPPPAVAASASAAAAPERRSCTPPRGSSLRRRPASSSPPQLEEEGEDRVLAQQLMRSLSLEANAANCMPCGCELGALRPLDPWLDAIESALAHASAATNACQSLGEVLRGRRAGGAAALSATG